MTRDTRHLSRWSWSLGGSSSTVSAKVSTTLSISWRSSGSCLVQYKGAILTPCQVVLQKWSIRRFEITEKAPTRAFSWLKAATIAFTFKTLLKLYAKLIIQR